MIQYQIGQDQITLDASLTDWSEDYALTTHKPSALNYGFDNIQVYGAVSATHYVFAIDATNWAGGQAAFNPSFLINADQDTSTGTTVDGHVNEAIIKLPGGVYDLGVGIDYRIDFVNNIPTVFDANGNQVDADIQYSWNHNVIEFSIERTAFGENSNAIDMQVMAFDGYYGVNYIPPIVTIEETVEEPTGIYYDTNEGQITIDTDLSDWANATAVKAAGAGTERLGTQDVELYSSWSDSHFVFAIDASSYAGGRDALKASLLFNTDFHHRTGEDVSGIVNETIITDQGHVFGHGIEYVLQFVDGGVPQLVDTTGAVVDADIQYAWTGDVIEFSVERAALGTSNEDVQVQMMVLDGQHGLNVLPPAIDLGDMNGMVMDGSKDDWSEANRLDAPENGIDGFAVYGTSTEDDFVIGIEAPVEIGATTTVWLNTDQNEDTGHQIWGWAGGAEAWIEFSSNGTPILYSTFEEDGQTFSQQKPLEFAYSEDRTFVEMKVNKIDVDTDQLNLLLDINNLDFLPTQYAETQYELPDTYQADQAPDFMMATQVGSDDFILA